MKHTFIVMATLALGCAGFGSPVHAHDAMAASHAAPHDYRNTPTTGATTIRGLGEHFPNTANISKSANYAVYKFENDGVAYVQINRLDGTVIAALALAGTNAYPLPIGKLDASRITISSDYASMQAQPQSSSGGQQCPCSAEVVFVGPNATIVVITDRNGNVVQVVTIPHETAHVDP